VEESGLLEDGSDGKGDSQEGCLQVRKHKKIKKIKKERNALWDFGKFCNVIMLNGNQFLIAVQILRLHDSALLPGPSTK
jgi:hypothetical protein